ncbi:MAG: phosphotransferase [Porticoccaceae bacterium]
MVVQVKVPPVVPRPYPARTGKLPWSKDEVTPQWLTSVFQNRYPGVVVESMEELQFIDSHTSKLRMKLQFNQAGREAGLPDQVCLKSNFSGLFDNVDICQLEAQFYHFLGDKMTVPVPKCYYADWDDDGKGHGVVILEDLTLRGGKFGFSMDDVGVDGVAKALEGMAQMHGDLWNSPLLDQPWLPVSMATPIDNDQIRIMQEWIDKNLVKPEFQEVLPQHFLDDPGKLQRAFDALAEWENSRNHPYCINLGDCHQGNTYHLPDGRRMWLDWQLVRKGRPWRDFTYFTVGALTIEERRASERDLIKHYRENLVATGAQGVPDVDEIFEQYRRWVLYGMQAWVANMDHWGQLGLPMNQRFFTAGEDLGTWTALLGS